MIGSAWAGSLALSGPYAAHEVLEREPLDVGVFRPLGSQLVVLDGPFQVGVVIGVALLAGGVEVVVAVTEIEVRHFQGRIRLKGCLISDRLFILATAARAYS